MTKNERHCSSQYSASGLWTVILSHGTCQGLCPSVIRKTNVIILEEDAKAKPFFRHWHTYILLILRKPTCFKMSRTECDSTCSVEVRRAMDSVFHSGRVNLLVASRPCHQARTIQGHNPPVLASFQGQYCAGREVVDTPGDSAWERCHAGAFGLVYVSHRWSRFVCTGFMWPRCGSSHIYAVAFTQVDLLVPIFGVFDWGCYFVVCVKLS